MFLSLFSNCSTSFHFNISQFVSYFCRQKMEVVRLLKNILAWLSPSASQAKSCASSVKEKIVLMRLVHEIVRVIRFRYKVTDWAVLQFWQCWHCCKASLSSLCSAQEVDKLLGKCQKWWHLQFFNLPADVLVGHGGGGGGAPPNNKKSSILC